MKPTTLRKGLKIRSKIAIGDEPLRGEITSVNRPKGTAEIAIEGEDVEQPGKLTIDEVCDAWERR